MRLIECDGCLDRKRYAAGPPELPDGWRTIGFQELCPACVEWAPEKPLGPAVTMQDGKLAKREGETLDEYELRRSNTPKPPGYVPERGETFTTSDSAESPHQAPWPGTTSSRRGRKADAAD